MVDDFLAKHNQAGEYFNIVKSIDEFIEVLKMDSLNQGKLSFENRGRKEVLHEKAYIAIKNVMMNALLKEKTILKQKIDDLYED